MAKQYLLPMETKLKLIKIDKVTFEESFELITFHEYQTLKRNKNYYYKAVQVI
jgi:hypothetical protein